MIQNSMVTYWFGVVEDINDPDMLDRVRVRVYGAHSANKQISDVDGTPTEHLMWMNTIMPVTSASFQGVGQRHGLLPGSTVFGMYIDPEMQTGIVLGQTQTKNESRDAQKGFQDPSGVYPNGLYEGGMQSLPMRGLGITDDAEDNRQGIQDGVGYQYDLEDNPAAPGEVTIDLITMADEGFAPKPYKDPKNDPKGYSIGFGHHFPAEKFDLNAVYSKLSKQVNRPVPVGGTITLDEAKYLLKGRLKEIEAQIFKNPRVALVYNQLDESRKLMLYQLCYQMGTGGVAEFQKALAALQAKDWKKAAEEFRNQKWFTQSGDRGPRVCNVFLTGNFEGYKPYLSEKLKAMGIQNNIKNSQGVRQTQNANNIPKGQDHVNQGFVDFTKNNTALNYAQLSKGVGQCAKRVADALWASGYKVERGHARDWNDGRLQKVGFNPISKNGYIPKTGDIVVFKPHGKDNSGGIYGHVQYYNGSKWVQDFGTNKFYANQKYASMGPSGYTIYRHSQQA